MESNNSLKESKRETKRKIKLTPKAISAISCCEIKMQNILITQSKKLKIAVI